MSDLVVEADNIYVTDYTVVKFTLFYGGHECRLEINRQAEEWTVPTAEEVAAEFEESTGCTF